MLLRVVTSFFFFLLGSVSAQQINGHVFDLKTKEPIMGASIYYDGSSIGTITDENGNFEIALLYENSARLVVRHLGYITKKMVNPSGGTVLQIGLKEEIESLNEVVLTSDPFSRKQKMKVFKLEFLGDTRGGHNSKIVNEEDIKLYFNTYNNTLSAYSEKPLVVQNDYLGYIIHFYIEEFKIFFKKKSLERIDNIYHTLYDGSTRFHDISEGSTRILERRKKAYLGSTMHFMRSCWHGDIESQNFKLKREFKEIETSEFFIEVDKNSPKDFKSIRFLGGQFIIYHKNKSNYRSTLKITEPDSTYLLDRYGNYTPYQDLVFGGYMANFRIGEMLPIDYGF